MQEKMNDARIALKGKLYKWHKYIGLITVVPVIFWCLSGLMHPFMAHWFKPQIANEYIEPKTINEAQMKLSFKEILDKNGIVQCAHLRTVTIGELTYLQVEVAKDIWQYFETSTGKEWKNGDKKYAEYLARFYLADSTSKIVSITQQTEFTQEYKYINRLLPVWKVSFARPDEMDVYVETPYSRMATYNTWGRKVFLKVFDIFHNWGFMNLIGNNSIRIVVMLLFLSVIVFSALSGILVYGFMWKRFAPTKKENPKSILRKYHRIIGISVALVTLTFAFSGGYHALTKWSPNTLPDQVVSQTLRSADLIMQLTDLKVDWNGCTNISVVAINGKSYFQCTLLKPDFMSEKKYYATANGSELKDGDFVYADFVAKSLNKTPSVNRSTAKLIVKEHVGEFEKSEYGFANKRLPVVRLGYDTPENTTQYVETATGRIAATIENSDRYEGYSFAILHKFLLLDWAGKDVRDWAMLISAFGILVVSLIGCWLFVKR